MNTISAINEHVVNLNTFNGWAKEILLEFIRLKTFFPSIISDVYLIPTSQLTNSEYNDKLNIVVAINGFSTLGYMHWAFRDKKSITSLWGEKETRAKFWAPKTMRLLLSLARAEKDNNKIKVWVRSYSRFFAVDSFINDESTFVQLSPKTMFKLTE